MGSAKMLTRFHVLAYKNVIPAALYFEKSKHKGMFMNKECNLWNVFFFSGVKISLTFWSAWNSSAVTWPKPYRMSSADSHVALLRSVVFFKYLSPV